MEAGKIFVNLDTKNVTEKLRIAAKHFNKMAKEFEAIDEEVQRENDT